MFTSLITKLRRTDNRTDKNFSSYRDHPLRGDLITLAKAGEFRFSIQKSKFPNSDRKNAQLSLLRKLVRLSFRVQITYCIFMQIQEKAKYLISMLVI